MIEFNVVSEVLTLLTSNIGVSLVANMSVVLCTDDHIY